MGKAKRERKRLRQVFDERFAALTGLEAVADDDGDWFEPGDGLRVVLMPRLLPGPTVDLDARAKAEERERRDVERRVGRLIEHV